MSTLNGPPQVCIYCQSKIGEPHGADCVVDYVARRIVAVKPKDSGGCIIVLECQHERHSNRPAEAILKWAFEYPCRTCTSALPRIVKPSP